MPHIDINHNTILSLVALSKIQKRKQTPMLRSNPIEDETVDEMEKLEFPALGETEIAAVEKISSVLPSSSSNEIKNTKQNNRKSLVSVKHYDSLVSELRCPGCAKPMYPPIKLCKTGHSICKACTKKLPTCPICTETFTSTRSVALEAIASKAYFNCSNTILGCTVRLPLDLMKWHKESCHYQSVECFMGKVWGDCEWKGCQINWNDHCMEQHQDKIFSKPEATILWPYELHRNSRKPVDSYYIFRVYGETFNLYQIYNKHRSRLTWTLICASKEPKINQKFAYEVEIFSPTDKTRIMLQRHACHAETDEDILDDGLCITFGVGDLMRFMDKQKVLHYRLKIILMSYLNEQSTLLPIEAQASNKKLPIDYNLTSISGINAKKVPHDNIIQRKETTEESKHKFLNGKFDTTTVVQENRKSFCVQNKITYNSTLNPIDKEIVLQLQDDLKKIMIKEFAINDNTNPFIVKKAETANRIPKPPRQSSTSPVSPIISDELKLQDFTEKKEDSSSLAYLPEPPIQKFIVKESVAEFARTSIHDIKEN